MIKELMIKINATISSFLWRISSTVSSKTDYQTSTVGTQRKHQKKPSDHRERFQKKPLDQNDAFCNWGLDIIINKESLIKNRAPNRQRHTRAERILQKGKQSTYAKAHKLVR